VTQEDRGDSLRLHSAAEPTDDEIRVLVEAAKARSWEGIRFTGGSPEWQRRARLEALKQGFPLDAISLECEDGQKPPVAALPMPDHVRGRLNPPKPPEEEAPAPMPTPALPAPDALAYRP
jgi:hypothetical protein